MKRETREAFQKPVGQKIKNHIQVRATQEIV